LVFSRSYVTGGIIVEKKLPKPYPMLPLAAKIREPGDTFAQPPSLCVRVFYRTFLLNLFYFCAQKRSLGVLA
jgi:hypothetical protein